MHGSLREHDPAAPLAGKGEPDVGIISKAGDTVPVKVDRELAMGY